MKDKKVDKIGFGGSCHWCTEAIFQSLKGVINVDQGWISSLESPTFSEAVIVHFNSKEIDLKILIEIHLRTHSSTSSHSMRDKYRSAIYTFSDKQSLVCSRILNDLQDQFSDPLITSVQRYDKFKLNTENYLDYYRKNPNKPFCRNVIDPKLRELRREFGKYVTL